MSTLDESHPPTPEHGTPDSHTELNEFIDGERRKKPGAPEVTIDRERTIARDVEPGREKGPQRDRANGEKDDPGGRREFFLASRLGPDRKLISGQFLRGSRQRHRAAYQQRPREGAPPAPPGPLGSVNWTPIGPSVVSHGQASNHPPVSGRITSIVAGPSGTRVYAGAANGGVWFTADAGSDWAPLDDYAVSPSLTSGLEADSLAVGAIAVRFGATSATDLVYVGTGEANSSGDSYFGVGVKRSSSGGAAGSWTLEGTNLAGRGFFRITIDPDDPTLVLAATTAGLFRRPAAAPFTAWTQITSTFASPNGMANDIVVAGAGATKRYYCVFESDKAYSSTDGLAWTALTGLPAGGRVALAVAESDPTVAYALKQDGTLWRLVGTTFQSVAAAPPLFSFGQQGWYDIAVAVDPANANTVYLVGSLVFDSDWTLSMFKSTLTGGSGTWNFGFNAANAGNPAADATYVGRGVHADGHAFAFALNAAGIAHDGTNVWVGTDGGIFQSTASAALGTFGHRNTGLAITEMEFLGQRQDTDAQLYAGCQDNGNVRFWGEPTWFESPEGDGGGVAIDANDEYRVIRQYVRAGTFWQDGGGGWHLSSALSTATDGGASGGWAGLNFPPITNANDAAQRTAATTENNSTGFYSPLAASPAGVSPSLAAFGTNRVWLTPDWGTTWTTLPTNNNPYALGGGPSTTQDALDGAVASVEFASGTRIFAATSQTVYRFDLSGGTWTRTTLPTTGLPAFHIITDLAVQDATMGTVYVALGSGGVDHVWFFDGTSWQTAGLAMATLDAPCHAIVVDAAHPENVYLGSDAGVWKGIKTGTTTWTWALFSQGLPEAVVTDLSIHQRTRLLRAATHGRGVWEIALDAATGLDPDLYVRVNYADTGRVNGGNRFPWVDGAQDPTAKGFNVYHWMSADIKVRRPSLGGPTVSSPPTFLDFSANIGDYIDTSHIETADDAGVNRIFVQVHNRALTPLAGSDVRVLLLVTDAAAGLPALPADYAARILAGDTTNWLSATPWKFADPMTPYRNVPNAISARTAQVVYYDFDFSTLALPAGHNHVCAAAFVTTISAADQLLNPGNTSLDALTLTDKHVCHRNLHLVPAGATPQPPGGSAWRHTPQTVVIDFHNAQREEGEIEILVDRRGMMAPLSMMLPKLKLASAGSAIHGWRTHEVGGLPTEVAGYASSLLERLGEAVEELGEQLELSAKRLRHDPAVRDEREVKLRKLKGIDRSLVYVADNTSATPTISGIRIPAGGVITAAITVRAPDGAKPGDVFRFDVLQKRNGTIVGGSTYALAVYEGRQ